MYQRILVPVDGSVLDAVSYCNGFETGAVYCSEVVPRMERTGALILDESRQRVERAGLKADTALLETLSGGIADLVLEHSTRWGADLIAMGTHGRCGADRFFMGSDAEQVMRGASVPVLLVRPTPRAEPETRSEGVASAAPTPQTAPY